MSYVYKLCAYRIGNASTEKSYGTSVTLRLFIKTILIHITIAMFWHCDGQDYCNKSAEDY